MTKIQKVSIMLLVYAAVIVAVYQYSEPSDVQSIYTQQDWRDLEFKNEQK